jgi:hypothetical protein
VTDAALDETRQVAVHAHVVVPLGDEVSASISAATYRVCPLERSSLSGAQALLLRS